MPEKILLFGGTFDPVHNGHLIVARELAERCGFDRVTLVPTAQPPHKPPAVASAEHRLEMLKLATEDDPVFDICDIELNREGPSYTIDTLELLKKAYGNNVELSWLIGADMLRDFHKWHRAQDVLKVARLLIVSRPPWDRRLGEVFSELEKDFSPELVNKLSQSIVQAPLIAISSTQIRKRVMQGKSIRYLVPCKIRSYIKEKGLYSN